VVPTLYVASNMDVNTGVKINSRFVSYICHSEFKMLKLGRKSSNITRKSADFHENDMKFSV